MSHHQQDRTPAERPNVVLVITDQQRFDTIAALGAPAVDTPTLDRLVAEGTAFTRTYVTAPSCSPSRASLFTGVYPHTVGVLRNETLWRHSWVESLAEAGYRCVNVGKMHTHPWETPLGFHERTVVENKDRAHPGVPFFHDQWDKALFSHHLVKPTRVTHREEADYREKLGAFEWELPEELHADRFVGAHARWWLETYPGDEPFFLQVGFPGPHPPYDPTPKALEVYRERDVPMPIPAAEGLADQPDALKELQAQHVDNDHDSVVHQVHPDPEAQRRQRRHYLANVTMIDEEVGALLDALEARGVLEETVVIFTSDHGDALGDHGHSQKWTMFESSVRVPAIVWGPGRIAQGRRVDALTSMMDLGPTVLELAGLTPPAWMEAVSLLPALAPDAGESAWTGREHVFSEHARDMILTGTELMTMVREERWKYVELLDSDQGQLFDLSADPDELVNLWDMEDHDDGAPGGAGWEGPRTARERLRAVVARWRASSALHTAEMFAQHR